MKSGKLTTKIISLFLCAVMLLSVMPLGVINAFAETDTDFEECEEHIYGEPEVIQAPTCTEDGYKARKCSMCGYIQPVKVTELPADTYPETSHPYQTECNLTFSYPGASSLKVTFDEFRLGSTSGYIYGLDPPCWITTYDNLRLIDSDGISHGLWFQESMKGKSVTISGDSITFKIDANCDSPTFGYTISEIVAYFDTQEVIPVIDHNYTEEIITAATCVSEGERKLTCEDCGEIKTETIEINYGVHDMSGWEIVTEPTCSTEGKKVAVCADCGYVYSSKITLASDTYPESSHSYPSSADLDYYFSYEGAENLYLTFSDSTYFEGGYDYLYIYDGDDNLIGEYSGSLAGETITVPGDSFSLRLTSDGSYNYYGFSFSKIEADVPGDEENYEVIPATGDHDYVSSITREATCSQEGEETYTCADCGYSYTESVERTSHTEEAIPDRDATCSDTGSQGGKRCSVCGTVTVAPTEIPMTDHTPGEWQVMLAATADTDGMKIRCCTVCGTETDRETIPAGTGVTQYLGDANNDGKVTAADARIILRHSAKIELLPDAVLHLADVNGDGKVNASDARIALRMASKLEGLIIYGSD